MIQKVERKYLEINSIKNLSSKLNTNSEVSLKLIDPPDFNLNKFFYKQVGKKHRWIDRLAWNDQKWMNYINNTSVETYVLFEKENPVGFFELIFHKDKRDCEIAYFGILEEYFGKGYGSHLLSSAIQNGFKKNSKRIWCHTCSLDHPNALKNYLARGMKIFKSEVLNLNIS